MIITDGAWGTQLQARGLPPGACPDAWNMERPDAVEAVARAYVAAGCQVILSNTFGANRIVLARHGLAERAAEIARAGAAISRRAAGTQARVFASLGPSGKLPSAEEISTEALRDAFREQADALAAGGADAVVVETMGDPLEATVAVEAVRAAGLPAVLSFTFDSGRNSDRTLTGLTVERAAQLAGELGAMAVGANCGLGAEQLLPLALRLRAVTALPLWLKPNAGRPEVVDGATVYRATPQSFSAGARALAAGAGELYLGGCCGTSPALLAQLVTDAR